jgi:hypothetical protein
MTPVADNPVVLPERQIEEERKPGESEPPHTHCPLCGWSPRKDDEWFCTCGNEWNTFDTGGVAQAASTSGLRPNASHVADGRRTRSS